MSNPMPMNDDQFQTLVELLHHQSSLLERIANVLEQPQGAPNYQASLEVFRQFDWTRIGAIVELQDADGVAVVTWHGNRFVRRSAANKFEPAIWFSRSIGKDEGGNNRYERLITFKTLGQVEPLPDKVRRIQGVQDLQQMQMQS
jgi:hypothetical protein